MIVMREILNVKQTQVHPGDPSYGWKWKAFLDDLSDRSSAAQRRQGKGNTRQGFQPESPLSTPDLGGLNRSSGDCTVKKCGCAERVIFFGKFRTRLLLRPELLILARRR